MNRPQNENREFERIGVRTAATAIIPYGPSWVACRAWTDDLSPGGARVLTERQITGQQFFIRVQLEGLSRQVFHCEIRRQGETLTKTLSDLSEINRYTYGVKFVGICSDPEILSCLEDNGAATAQ